MSDKRRGGGGGGGGVGGRVGKERLRGSSGEDYKVKSAGTLVMS